MSQTVPTRPNLTQVAQFDPKRNPASTVATNFSANEKTAIATANSEHMFESRTYSNSNINEAIILCAERIN